MSVFKDDYNRIVSEIEQNITDQEQLKFIKEKISELSMIFLDAIDNLSNVADEKIRQIEEKQKIIEEKMSQVESAVNDIESDIYIDEENYDFEIVCPYCDYEFVTEIDGKNEISCPNCNNIIELDWNDEEDEGCTGHCSGCHGCGEEDNEDDM